MRDNCRCNDIFFSSIRITFITYWCLLVRFILRCGWPGRIRRWSIISMPSIELISFAFYWSMIGAVNKRSYHPKSVLHWLLLREINRYIDLKVWSAAYQKKKYNPSFPTVIINFMEFMMGLCALYKTLCEFCKHLKLKWLFCLLS